jgi:2-oxoglutarate dehydrogenase E1 component
VFTPKSLLRHPKATSSLAEFTTKGFQRVIPDTETDAKRVRRVLICTGKIYYDLERERQERKREDVAIVRFEQLYPLSESHVRAALERYEPNTPVFWVQEEPENMGAWRHLRAQFGQLLLDRFPFSGVCRAESASPATGSPGSHKLEQQEIIDKAFAGTPVALSTAAANVVA